MTIAYIYKWTHIPTSKWYIGSRTKINCHPDDGYICSSKIVKPMIKLAPDDWRREVLVVGIPSEIIILEYQLLQSLDAKNNLQSYNMHNGDGNFTTAGIIQTKEWRDKVSAANRGKVRSPEAIENYRRANQLKAQNPDYIVKLKKPKHSGFGAKVSASTKGKKKTDKHRAAMSAARKGKKTGPCPDSRRESISAALKGKHTLPLKTCPHCGLVGRANMQRWHFNNCKKVTIK